MDALRKEKWAVAQFPSYLKLISKRTIASPSCIY